MQLRHYMALVSLPIAGAGGPFLWYGNPAACALCMSISLLLISLAAIMTPDLPNDDQS